jgi:GT2 family glycosyltransferase
MVETAVIIPHYNGWEILDDCLRTLLKSDYQDFEVILVDNASEDDSVKQLRKRYAKELKDRKIRLIANKKNEGFAEGNNIGYRAVRDQTKFVVLLNNDSVVPKEWLTLLTGVMRQHPDCGIAGSIIINKTGKVDIAREIRHAEWTAITLNMEFGSTAPRSWHKKDWFDAFYVSGNGMIVRKAMFPTLFNPDYFAYAEDIDIGWNCQLRGLRVILSKTAYLQHHNSATKKSGSRIGKISIFNGTKNQIVNYFTHYEWKNIIRIFPLFVLTQLAQIAYSPYKIIVKLKAYFWVLWRFPTIMRYRKKVQSVRTIPDSEIIPRLSAVLYSEVIATGWKKKALRFVNNCCILYCRIVRLNVVEFRKKR